MTTRFTAPVVLPCDASCSVLRNGAVDVADGRITWVGPVAEAPPARPAGTAPRVRTFGSASAHVRQRECAR